MSVRDVETVVTYLAADGPPRPPPDRPAGLGLTVMRAEAIPPHYYRYLYRTVGENWLWFERLLLDDQALEDQVNRAGVEVHVLYAGGVPAGYFELGFETEQRTDLVYFGLTPEWSGRRIGPWLLARAMETGFARGAAEMLVNTCTLDHPAALPLYRRLGFRPVAEAKRTLRVPAEVAIPSHIAARITP